MLGGDVKIFRFIGATLVIFSMMSLGLTQSMWWLITLIIFLIAWLYYEKYLEEIEHREFWQGIAMEQSSRHLKNKA